MSKLVCKICKWPRKHNNPLISKCKDCIYKESENNPKQTRIKPISDKRKKRLSWYSEKDLYRDILIERQIDWLLTCEYCNKDFRIEDAIPATFAHILAKSMYPQLRLFKNNIAIVCPDINTDSCHTKIDWLVTWNKRW